jgi:putative membrane protein insertion efficiency factor
MPLSPVSRPSSVPFWNGVQVADRRARPGLGARLALRLIRAYKVAISPWFMGACRYVPSCADYTAEAIAVHGLIRGSWLGARRLARCHPFGGSGLDPVPRD